MLGRIIVYKGVITTILLDWAVKAEERSTWNPSTEAGDHVEAYLGYAITLTKEQKKETGEDVIVKGAHWLLFQRTKVQFPTPIWLTINCNSSSEIWFYLLASRDITHMLYTDTCWQNFHIYEAIGLEVKGPYFSSRDLEFIPSNHMVACTICNEIRCPLLVCRHTCRQNTVYIIINNISRKIQINLHALLELERGLKS